MSLFCVQTQDLSWQDRTINTELMMAPARSQLLYNKHKGLKTKCEQRSYNLEREKDSFLKSYKTEHRLMERRRDSYVKVRNDIILRRSARGTRRSSLSGPTGHISAPPRLEAEMYSAGSRSDNAFITEIRLQGSKSADARTTFLRRSPEQMAKLAPLDTPEMTSRQVSACTRSPTPGKPYLLRNKSVRFLPGGSPCPHANKDVDDEEDYKQLPVEERIKRFLNAQSEFNIESAQPTRHRRKSLDPNMLRHQFGGLQVNSNKLESAFEEFVGDGTMDGFQKMKKYATKLKATVRNAQNSQIMPRRKSVFALT
ncbi:uncharacterized protein LOC128223488 [Mya arenaria]|uniref:uncharacterized protein LOC128223488 n=1 Tax=Mya arenaria TaxID=6604 RepID=UPI0022E1B3E4|nr:uncharacterized protein LOC128223488 [Mya arenaria]